MDMWWRRKVSFLVSGALFLLLLLFVNLLFLNKAAHLLHCPHLSQTVIWLHPQQHGTRPQTSSCPDCWGGPDTKGQLQNLLGSEPGKRAVVSELCSAKGMKTAWKCLGFLKRLWNRAATRPPRMIFINRRRALVENSQNGLHPCSCSAWLTFEAAFCGLKSDLTFNVLWVSHSSAL